jgi:hypothetical protein
MDERLDWLFRDGHSGLTVSMLNGAVVIESYSAGGYGYEDTNETHYLDAAKARQLRDWLVENVRD